VRLPPPRGAKGYLSGQCCAPLRAPVVH
jgi:hypothetical protein